MNRSILSRSVFLSVLPKFSMFIGYCLFCFVNNLSYSDIIHSNSSGHLFRKVIPIAKESASYKSPEDTYISMISALYAKDLDWYYETLTTETATQNKKLYKDSGISPERKFNTVNNQKEFYIIEKFQYQQAIILIVMSLKIDGTIMKGPSAMIQEDENWKITNLYSRDEQIHSYMEYYKRQPMAGKTEVIYGGVHYDRQKKQFYSDVRITNISNQELEGPVWLKITNLTPRGAVLENADGMHFNAPFVIVLDNEMKWHPGETLLSKKLYFSNTDSQRISFDEIVYAVISNSGHTLLPDRTIYFRGPVRASMEFNKQIFAVVKDNE